jgi:hypothetical protein
MSNISNLGEIGDFSNTNEIYESQSTTQPTRIETYPFLGVMLILLSAALICGGAYYLLAS